MCRYVRRLHDNAALQTCIDRITRKKSYLLFIEEAESIHAFKRFKCLFVCVVI